MVCEVLKILGPYVAWWVQRGAILISELQQGNGRMLRAKSYSFDDKYDTSEVCAFWPDIMPAYMAMC